MMIDEMSMNSRAADNRAIRTPITATQTKTQLDYVGDNLRSSASADKLSFSQHGEVNRFKMSAQEDAKRGSKQPDIEISDLSKVY